MKKVWMITISLIVLVLLFLIIKSSITGNTIETRETIFAQCLTNAGLSMYGADWCSHCQNQKALFGKQAFKKINYVDCDTKSQICKEEGVEGYPTWKINGESYSGEQSFERLGQLTGCVY